MDEFAQKIKDLTKKDLQSIMDKNLPHCKRLEGLLYVNKKLEDINFTKQT